MEQDTDRPTSKRQAPIWLLVVIALASAAIAGTAAFFVAARGTSAASDRAARLVKENADLSGRIHGLESRVATLTAALVKPDETPTADATVTSVAASSAPPAKPVRQFSLIKSIKTGPAGYKLVADFAELLTGQAAVKAAAAHGESVEGEQLYIQNDNKKLRDLVLPAGADVELLGWGGLTGPDESKVAVAQFADIMGTADTDDPWKTGYYWITYKGTEIIKVEQQYFP